MAKIFDYTNLEDFIEEHFLYSMVNCIHHNCDDFIDGDIGERIEESSMYKLVTIDLNTDVDLNEWYVDEVLVEETMEEITNCFESTPVPLISKDFSIIDGIHRLNAFKAIGYTTIQVYQGV